MRDRLPWSLFALTCLIAVGHVTVLAFDDRPLLTTHSIAAGFPLVTIGAVTGAGVGALILTRYPHHRIGWLFLIGQLLTEFDVAAQAYGEAALNGDIGAAPAGHLAIWLSVMFGSIVTLTYLAILFLLAPDGQLLSRRWRWAAYASIAGVVAHTAAVASVRPSEFDAESQVEGGAGPVVEALVLGGLLLVCLGLTAAAVSLVIRLRRSSGTGRHQLWWMVLAAGALTAGALVGVTLAVAGAPNWVAVLPLMVGYVCVPLFTGVAVLRHRLYDLDLLINRAIALTVLTTFVTAGYVVLVVVIGRLVTPAEDAFWPSVLATTIVALAFQPLRTRVGRFADRVVYGAQAVPYEELADFSKGLQEAPATPDLLPRVAETIGRAVGARQVSIWLQLNDQCTAVQWPDDEQEHAPDLNVSVVSDGDQLGGFGVAMPPGRALRPSQEQLLRDFAQPLAHAFQIARLQAELAARVHELDDKTVELAASSARLARAQDDERRRFKAAIRHAVLPHVEQLPAALRRMSADVRREPSGAAEQLDALTQATIEALESLRTLTRGVFPAQLAHRGLVSALSSHLADAGLAGVFEPDASVVARRFDPRVESATYFCAVEFLRELEEPQRLALKADEEHLTAFLAGRTSTDVSESTRHLLDRAAALGGQAEVRAAGGVVSFGIDIPLRGRTGAAPGLQDRVLAER
jgi:uncharacterized membrane protein YhaH (DUF805 family)